MRLNRLTLRGTRGGFSLIELLIVVAILAIVSTIAIGSTISALPHANLEKGQEAVAYSLSQARMLSLSEEVAVRMKFDTGVSPQQYWYEKQDRTTLAWSIATSGGAKQTLPVGITITGNTFPAQTVTFTPRGTLLVGGTLTFRNTQGQTNTLVGNVATGRFPLVGGNTR